MEPRWRNDAPPVVDQQRKESPVALSSPVLHPHRHDATPSARGGQRVTRAGSLRVATETMVVTLGALLYFFVRGLMETRVSLAHANAERIVDFERALGIFHEPWLQSRVLETGWLATLANRIYIFGHWPVIAATLTWLIWKHRESFATYRSALLISGAIGLVVFVAFPVAPPRFLPEYGFIDTVTLHTHAYRVLQPPAFTNQYAAVPSLHVGWNLLMGIAIVRHTSNRWAKAFGWSMPVVMWLATVVTANHYLIDGIAGSIVALTGLALAVWLQRRRARAAAQRQHPVLRSLGQGWSQREAA
jgi:membrane-associated phospholipid phosphatase